MENFESRCQSHAGLESFAPDAFAPDAEANKEICAFVLALAAVYNDAKDIGYAMELLDESLPKTEPCISRVWGNSSGIRLHINRNFLGLLHELFKLIETNTTARNDKFMKKIEKTMTKPGRESWTFLVGVALGAVQKDPLGRVLVLARNKVGFHYDARQIHRGYSERFLGPGTSQGRGFVSRGDSMVHSRFYFADAAVQKYLEDVICEGNWPELVKRTHEIFYHLNHALMELVTGFLQLRAKSYRQERDEIA